jgi:alkylhydroperoxidase/carboxymuconolactone decarboxylase family protein YurZ
MASNPRAQENHDDLFPNYASTLAASDPELIDAFDNFAFDEVLSHGGLDQRIRLMVQVSAIIASHALLEYRVMLGAALNAGVTPVEAKEVLYQAVPYVGIAKVIDFLHVTNQIMTERSIELRLPVLFHTGRSGIGTNLPGGGGIRQKYGNQMHIDDVAVDFPDMPIIMAHPSFPWQDEAISVCLHKPTVYIDLSGWSPKYFSPTLVQYANTLLKTKVLFGSDYPLITPDRWMADFEKIAIRDDVRPLIFKENAIRLFGLNS